MLAVSIDRHGNRNLAGSGNNRNGNQAVYFFIGQPHILCPGFILVVPADCNILQSYVRGLAARPVGSKLNSGQIQRVADVILFLIVSAGYQLIAYGRVAAI